VDVRQDSPQFGQWVGVTLSAEIFHQLYIPVGFVHGFCVVSGTAQFEYKCSDYYDPGHEVSIRWNGEEIGIDWPSPHPSCPRKRPRRCR
jgi:dTDP-4-dehydrorhamnose 3,5-epimerase